MADAALQLKARSAFDGLLVPGGPKDAGIVVTERKDLQIATVIARSSGFAEAIKTAYGIALPSGPKRIVVHEITLLGTGPRAWFALRAGERPLASDLEQSLGEHAAVADQSDGYGVLRVSGAKVRALLAKGVPIDLHPRAFAADDVAVTVCSHIGIMLWRSDADSSFDIAMFRSLCGSFWSWLSESAEEFGLRVEAE
ncbi:MAG: sarcosine oxidase subunit gamma [Rhizobiales bacterium]|nr:sarcosine oxidase subunit gamma [Hyphomicrobiales bacterium]